MRHDELRRRNALLAEEQQIEIERARRVGEAAPPAMAAFNRLQLAKELECLELGVEARDRIDELRLRLVAKRCAGVERRTRREAAARYLAQLVERPLDLGAGISEVRADADIRRCHALAGVGGAAGCFFRRRRRRLRGPVSGSSIAFLVSASALWNARHHASSSAGTSPLAARTARKS